MSWGLWSLLREDWDGVVVVVLLEIALVELERPRPLFDEFEKRPPRPLRWLDPLGLAFVFCFSYHQSGYPWRRKHSVFSCPFREQCVHERFGTRNYVIAVADCWDCWESVVGVVDWAEKPIAYVLCFMERIILLCCSSLVTRKYTLLMLGRGSSSMICDRMLWKRDSSRPNRNWWTRISPLSFSISDAASQTHDRVVLMFQVLTIT